MDVNGGPSMLSVTNSLISGGTFTQNNDNRQTVNVNEIKISGFDLLTDEVASSAFHNSSVRSDPPRCHENTRVEVIRTITRWISNGNPDCPIPQVMWLHGAAGAGKTAISQSIAEQCAEKGQLLASFFFGGSDASRNQANRLFPTIAYQVALALPGAREKLSEIIEKDPLIFTRSLSPQFKSLIIDPLCHAASLPGSLNVHLLPRLVLMDGLDECTERRAQTDILEAVFGGIGNLPLPPLRFLISSRTEHELSVKFSSFNASGNLSKFVLDASCSPEEDIEFYLKARLENISENHPFRRHIPANWPTSENMQYLARKSSGQFIYASTVVKYVGSIRHRPHHRLEIILNIRPPQDDHPFAELDTLYKHVLSTASNMEYVLLIISFYLIENFTGPLEVVEDLLSLERGDIEIHFCDLSSIIAISQTEGEERPFHFLHETLHDFLLDKARSKQYHVNLDDWRRIILHKCFQLLSTRPFTNSNLAKAHRLAMRMSKRLFLDDHFSSPELRADLVSFPVSQKYVELKNGNVQNQSLILDYKIRFLPWFLRLLRNKEMEGAALVNLNAFEDTLKLHLADYYADPYLTYLVSCVGYSARCHGHEFKFRAFQCFAELNFRLRRDIDAQGLTLLSVTIPDYYLESKDYLQLLSDFLLDRTRSHMYALDGLRYATAAILCLYHLCDNHRSLRPVVEGQFPTMPQLGTSDYLGVLDQAAFFLNQAERTDGLVHICRRGNFGMLARMSYPSYKRLWEATDKYLKRVDNDKR